MAVAASLGAIIISIKYPIVGYIIVYMDPTLSHDDVSDKKNIKSQTLACRLGRLRTFLTHAIKFDSQKYLYGAKRKKRLAQKRVVVSRSVAAT